MGEGGCLTLTMPIPPSSNNMFINVPNRGRVKSKAYKAWIEDAGWTILQQGIRRIAGPVTVHIRCKRLSGRADIDNRVKPVLDLLVLHRAIDDDRNVARVSAEWADVESCTATITPVLI